MLRLPRTQAVVDAVAGSLEVVDSSPSTNAVLRERAEVAHAAVLVTDHQTAGRGRLDRAWSAPAGASVAVSVALRPIDGRGRPLSTERLGWIPLAAGLAMVDALDPVLPAPVALKWPNDVLVGGAKLCGVLAELASSGALVVGAGLNTRMTPAQRPVPTATSLAIEGAPADDDTVDGILARYLRALLDDAAALADGDAAATGLAARVAARCATLGSRVRVELPGGGASLGIAVGLDDAGRLRVRGDGGAETTVAAGDVVHVR
ncbi:MAG: biotin--[acetyl-CoA-carboxylase] ligase [Actinomycetales bacterium]|nr:biotin--[acetyl-CoA-carboxylase] ligase [Actinomycetales bacterium]